VTVGLVVGVTKVIPGVAEVLADLVAGVADCVAKVLAIAVAPGFLGVLLAFAVGLLDVVHGVRLPCDFPMPGWACPDRTSATGLPASPAGDRCLSSELQRHDI